MFKLLHQNVLNIQIQLLNYDMQQPIQLLYLLFQNQDFYLNFMFIPFFNFILVISLKIHLIREQLILKHAPKLQRAIILHNLLYLIMKVLHTYLNEYQLMMELFLILFQFLMLIISIIKHFLIYHFFYRNKLNYYM